MWTFFAESVMSSDIEADLSVPIIKRWDDSGLFLGFFFGYNQLLFASIAMLILFFISPFSSCPEKVIDKRYRKSNRVGP